MVKWAPLGPIETLAPLPLKFKRTPGIILKLWRNLRKPMCHPKNKSFITLLRLVLVRQFSRRQAKLQLSELLYQQFYDILVVGGR
jgi:hypothetical protein